MLAEALPSKRIRIDTFGFMPRGNIATISPVDQKEAFEAGAFAVPEGSASVALQFDGERTIPKRVPLSRVAGKTRLMPERFPACGGEQALRGRHGISPAPAAPEVHGGQAVRRLASAESTI
jgi:6-phosphofructokinase 1